MAKPHRKSQPAGAGGPESPLPHRRCIARGESLPVTQLIRCVVDPENRIVPDLEGKLPGRGIWISADRQAVELATAKNLFRKAARAQVDVAPGFADQLARLLAQRALNLLGLAKRAGLVTTGFEKARAELQKGGVVALLTASDGAGDGRAKMLSAVKAAGGEARHIGLFSIDELSLALGKENVVHAVLSKGGLAQRFLTECDRLSSFRADVV